MSYLFKASVASQATESSSILELGTSNWEGGRERRRGSHDLIFSAVLLFAKQAIILQTETSIIIIMIINCYP